MLISSKKNVTNQKLRGFVNMHVRKKLILKIKGTFICTEEVLDRNKLHRAGKHHRPIEARVPSRRH